MRSSNRDYTYADMERADRGTRHVLTGILVGGIIGAAAMMFLAPRTGEEMRAEVRDKAMDLRDRTAGTLKETVSQVTSKASQLRGEAKHKARDLRQTGQDTLVETLDRVAEAVDQAKKAVESM